MYVKWNITYIYVALCKCGTYKIIIICFVKQTINPRIKKLILCVCVFTITNVSSQCDAVVSVCELCIHSGSAGPMRPSDSCLLLLPGSKLHAELK